MDAGHGPDPPDFVPPEYQTWEGRYDDPDHTWRTLYLARDAYGAWVEVLGRFRPDDDLAAALKDITSEEGTQRRSRRPGATVMPVQIEYPSGHGETNRCIAVFETDGDLPDIAPVGEVYGPAIEADGFALERAMKLHNLSWEL